MNSPRLVRGFFCLVAREQSYAAVGVAAAVQVSIVLRISHVPVDSELHTLIY